VRREVLVALLVTGVLGDEVEVLAADDDGAVHLGGNDSASQDTAADRDEASEGALLVDVGAFDGGLGGPEAETNVLVETSALAARLGGLDLGLGLETNVRLLEESTLALDSQLGGHFCDLSVVVESQRGWLGVFDFGVGFYTFVGWLDFRTLALVF